MKTPFGTILTTALLLQAMALSAAPADRPHPALDGYEPLHDTLIPRTAPFARLSRAMADVKALFTPSCEVHADVAAPVQIAGRLLARGSHRDEVVRVLDVHGHCVVRGTVDLAGRFRLQVPKDARLELHFSKPGHLDKVVRIDTRHAVDTGRARRTNRNVRFDVVLLRETEMPGMAYDGPVGTITFVRGSGLMKVQHHERLLPLSADR